MASLHVDANGVHTCDFPIERTTKNLSQWFHDQLQASAGGFVWGAQQVPQETIQRILDLARRNPSAGFTQGQDFVVVTRPETKQAIARLCGEEDYVEAGFHPFISGAPVLIVPCTNEAAYHRRYQEPDKRSPSLKRGRRPEREVFHWENW